MHHTWLSCALTALCVVFAAPAHAQQITETFDNITSLSNGTAFGSCQQLVAISAGGGSLAVASSRATLTTSAIADAAAIASAAALPATYRIRSELRGLTVDPNVAQNFADLLTVVVKQPQAAAATYYDKAAAVEVIAYPGFGIVIGVYADDDSGQTWDGSAWVTGYVAAVPTFAAGQRFEIVIDKDATGLKVTISRDGSQIIDTTRIAPGAVRSAPGYLVIGDAVTDLGASSVAVDAVEMPRPAGCTIGGDGPAQDAGPDQGPSPDQGPAPDQGPTPDQGPALDQFVPSDTGATFDSGARFDVAFNPNPDDRASDGCAISSGSLKSSLGLTLLLLLAFVLLGRRRR